MANTRLYIGCMYNQVNIHNIYILHIISAQKPKTQHVNVSAQKPEIDRNRM